MSKFFRNEEPPPTPEELQRRLEETLKQMGLHESPFFKSTFSGQGGESRTTAAADEPGDSPPAPNPPDDLKKFHRKPKEVKEFLDRYVIRQDEAKKVLSVALCDHYNHVRLAREGKSQSNYSKQNVILLGPTGVGKTYLVRSMAELIGVPFVKADATKFSETGYVGADVEELVRSLVRQADGDVESAQYGIIYLDEIDKIASASANQGGRDVSGRGVQTNLLKLMEETEVPTRAPNDISGQFEMMMQMTGGGGRKRQPSTINTRHILFIVSGAFEGLEKIVTKRLREASIGFSAARNAGDDSAQKDAFDQATTRDFIDFGFEPEFIGRLPVRVVCKALGEDDLYQILKSSEGSIVRQYEQSFEAYKIEVFFQEDALREIARQAAQESTGARGLMTVCERVFRQYKFELPSTKLKRFVVTREVILNPEAELSRLLAEGERERFKVCGAVVHEFAERFAQSHGIRIRFTDEAAILLAEKAEAQGISVRDYCARSFENYQFGLKLILPQPDQEEFLLGPEAVENPDAWLSTRVLKSYRPPEKKD
ncbi:MAG: ATP-dependent Clp protease ATP-binding subunit ClpX [Limisphaerales bacterium]|jgi:ATP-dependent Clp protease ATP-binding subunit ClpX|nr:ATP-dependent Clp protease ATP-binding subunit ClpX [Verrucomicrobiota bacterium]